jgi:hypothetical protein
VWRGCEFCISINSLRLLFEYWWLYWYFIVDVGMCTNRGAHIVTTSYVSDFFSLSLMRKDGCIVFVENR